MKAYLDNSATTKPHDEVIRFMTKCMEETYGNPSSFHTMGLSAERILKEAGSQVSDALGCRSDELVFTSGGTEANNMAIIGAAMAGKRKGRKIVTSKGEHPSVLETFRFLETRGFQAVYVDIDGEGRVDVDRMAREVNEETVLISLMHVNNEVGTVQPIEEIARLKGGALFHTDAVQSFGKKEIPLKGVDLVSLSGHKIHGPKGVGALYIRKGVHLPSLIHGGGQERGLRSGTENVPAIGGMGIAARMAQKNMSSPAVEGHIKTLRTLFLKVLSEQLGEEEKEIRINSPQEDGKSLPQILNISFLGTKGEVLLHMVEQENVYVSTGSACSSNKKGKSHVLTAMGRSSTEIDGALRISMSYKNTEEEVAYGAGRIAEAVKRFKSLGR